MKLYKQVKRENSIDTLEVYGSNRWIKTAYAKPEWSEELEEYFIYRGHRYYLSEFMRVESSAPEWMQEFDGYAPDSFFSGVLVKVGEHCDGDTGVKAFLYIS